MCLFHQERKGGAQSCTTEIEIAQARWEALVNMSLGNAQQISAVRLKGHVLVSICFCQEFVDFKARTVLHDLDSFDMIHAFNRLMPNHQPQTTNSRSSGRESFQRVLRGKASFQVVSCFWYLGLSSKSKLDLGMSQNSRSWSSRATWIKLAKACEDYTVGKPIETISVWWKAPGEHKECRICPLR